MIDSILKIVQIFFYILGGSLAVLTYKSARKGLLNTVNTEYHKKVIERLASLSDDLYEEFDRKSPKYWPNALAQKEFVRRIGEIRDHNPDWFASNEFSARDVPVPVLEIEQHLNQLSGKFRSDPFLPLPIRAAVLSYLDKRSEAISDTNREVAFWCYEKMASDPKWIDLPRSADIIHNRIVSGDRNRGMGVADVEAAVHNIRIMIQDYFFEFNPVNRKEINFVKPKIYMMLSTLVNKRVLRR